MAKERGYTGSVVQLRRYVQTVRPAARTEAFLRLRTMPGGQAQVDWGNFGKIQVGHARRALSCFVLVLSWSRAIYARFALDQTLESFLRGHVEAFNALHGVPRTILYDNLKGVVLERAGDHIRFHPRVLDLAGHYHFAPKPCAPYRGNEEGKVERAIQYLRHGFFAARRFTSVQDLNPQLAAWIERTADARKVPGDPAGRLVRDALEEERPRLLPLPEHALECDVVKPVASGKTPYIHFDLNDYSIPHHLVSKPLTLVASETLVRITNSGGHVFASHARSYDRKQVIEDPEHVAELAREKRRAHDLRGRDRLRSACPSADPFVEALGLRGENLGGHVSRLLTLLDRYGAAELDWALEDALGRGAIGAASVAHLLDQRARARKAPPALDVVLPDDPRARDLRLTPHALDTYEEHGVAGLDGGVGDVLGDHGLAQPLVTTAAQMLLDLGSQESARGLDQRLRHYCTRTGLIVIEEIGYLSYDNRNADLLFQVASRRYEKRSVVLTTNLTFSDWPSVFPNAACTTALIDRLVHHSEIISIEGKSYRAREAEEAKPARRKPRL